MLPRNGGEIGGMTVRQDGFEINVKQNEYGDIWMIWITCKHERQICPSHTMPIGLNCKS